MICFIQTVPTNETKQTVLLAWLGSAAAAASNYKSTGGRKIESASMSIVKYITSPADISEGQNYVLVMYGEKYEQTTHPLGFTITVAHNASKTVSDLSFLTAVHSAKELAKREGISRVFACK
jgi:hypothetical protein